MNHVSAEDAQRKGIISKMSKQVGLSGLDVDGFRPNPETYLSVASAAQEKIVYALEQARAAGIRPEDDLSIGLNAEEALIALGSARQWDELAEPHEPMLYEMGFIYLVALFDALIADSLQVFMGARPEVLKSGRQVSYEEVIGGIERGDLVSRLVTRELTELTYKPLRAQIAFLEDKLGVEMSASGVATDDLVEIRARRNLFVHNNGVVNEIYREAAPSTKSTIGRRLSIDDGYFTETSDKLGRASQHLVQRLIEKLPA